MRAADKNLGMEDDNLEDDLELDEETLNRAHSFCPGVFGVFVNDKSQKIKSERTVTYKSVKDILAPKTLGLVSVHCERLQGCELEKRETAAFQRQKFILNLLHFCSHSGIICYFAH